MEGARVEPVRGFTTMEKLVVALIARGESYVDAGRRLHIARDTVRFHATNAAGKLPGDLPVLTKLLFWSRGATKEQMTGKGYVPKGPSRTEMERTRLGKDLELEEYPLY
jgi:hypothetical protein